MASAICITDTKYWGILGGLLLHMYNNSGMTWKSGNVCFSGHQMLFSREFDYKLIYWLCALLKRSRRAGIKIYELAN